MVLLSCWLENVLRATKACTFSTSQLPRVVRTWGVFTFFTYKCASRHNGVPFLISYLASWLRTRRFSEPTIRPSGATNHWKDTVNQFSHTCIFLLPTLSLLWSSHFLTSPLWLFPPLLFHLCILSEVWLLNFLRSYHIISYSYSCSCSYSYSYHIISYHIYIERDRYIYTFRYLYQLYIYTLLPTIQQELHIAYCPFLSLSCPIYIFFASFGNTNTQ